MPFNHETLLRCNVSRLKLSYCHIFTAYALRCTRNRFYRLWYIYYQRYRTVTKIFKALYHKRVIVRISYVDYYNTHYGFTLKGKTFVYKGQSKLIISNLRTLKLYTNLKILLAWKIGNLY